MKGWQWLLLFGVVALALGGGYAATGAIVGGGGIIQSFANAIATAEGFYVSGSKAQRQNNPGNITDSTGTIQTYPTLQDGWNALYSQVSAMFNNTSGIYNSGMSIMQVGMIYSNGDPNWGNNVASALGVSSQTTLDTLAGSS